MVKDVNTINGGGYMDISGGQRFAELRACLWSVAADRRRDHTAMMLPPREPFY
jgi:hypothetical protein